LDISIVATLPAFWRDLCVNTLREAQHVSIEKENKMPTYISLLRFTQEGAKNIKESPARLEGAKKLFQSMGGELKEWYLTMGQYDAIVVSEGPDDETAAKLLLMIGAQGNIQTETFRAFTEDEYRKIIAALP